MMTVNLKRSLAKNIFGRKLENFLTEFSQNLNKISTLMSLNKILMNMKKEIVRTHRTTNRDKKIGDLIVIISQADLISLDIMAQIQNQGRKLKQNRNLHRRKLQII